MVRKLKSCKRQVDQPFVVKLKAAAVVMSLAKVSSLDENGQGDGTTDKREREGESGSTNVISRIHCLKREEEREDPG